MNINANHRSTVEFRKPDAHDTAEISAFKEELQKHKSGMEFSPVRRIS